MPEFNLLVKEEYQIAILIVIAIILGKLLSLFIEFIFKKTMTQQYITKSDCLSCKNQIAERRSELSMQIRIIKGLLLVMAVKVGVPDEQLRDLVDDFESRRRDNNT